MIDQTNGLDWRDGNVPVSRRFDDPYYSLDNGLEETRHVFLTGNGLPERLRDGFQIAELGFGTGLNLLATLKLWRDTGQTGMLRFTSFELYPLAAPDMLRAQAQFPGVEDIATELRPHWEAGATRITLPDLTFEMIVGDARETVPAWNHVADAWFLDGFSPAKNPELWEPDLLTAVAQHTAPDGTAATYSAAGAVRRALDAAGLQTQRIPGFGRKRHMTIAAKA
ncbi:tRNA (5-methylaminomethyl-2-thiouridine)(34)-methyltransferase MnmD [Pseudoprimorskyibacter insulae]|uniref:tRNA 5-methylaminomethyl-2-thiouridine biosynthesis bifunctional protein MnmC n=1 Tax=Pseudoprimorskyibacter insulae TaxID=1695997 RepID=A0A2R8AV35_9RHOB|nr:tRNA (5-methylaminomethyl-2-thiouridine)(34)-methyltransferase MnmD [Pseudoprimorskyibacter insulae]SPF79902.1 tRNA 5-methylaminomethyl-2-thiouridine biosynthesis bifunctional protein MnmC [Pseudoprimorskyibacter insulae]